jgi:NAD(P)-dependent dehydrogenase (short-subunit alcohol dehydrogenase family)
MTDRVTLITGASAGIGAELARVFASKGHRLALVDRRGDRLLTLAGEIAAAGGTTPFLLLIFEAKAFSPALIFCEFVKCTLLIDHSTATSVYRMRVRRLQYRQARTGRTARGLYVRDNFFDRPLEE